MHEPLHIKRKKDENIYSPLEKWVAVRKQITDSETLIANKMLNSLAVREIQIKQWNTESLKNQIVRYKKTLNLESIEGHVRETTHIHCWWVYKFKKHLAVSNKTENVWAG